jgi:hypothetical protein
MILPFATIYRDHSTFKNQRLLSVPVGLTFQNYCPFGQHSDFASDVWLDIYCISKETTIAAYRTLSPC